MNLNFWGLQCFARRQNASWNTEHRVGYIPSCYWYKNRYTMKVSVLTESFWTHFVECCYCWRDTTHSSNFTSVAIGFVKEGNNTDSKNWIIVITFWANCYSRQSAKDNVFPSFVNIAARHAPSSCNLLTL